MHLIDKSASSSILTKSDKYDLSKSSEGETDPRTGSTSFLEFEGASIRPRTLVQKVYTDYLYTQLQKDKETVYYSDLINSFFYANTSSTGGNFDFGPKANGIIGLAPPIYTDAQREGIQTFYPLRNQDGMINRELFAISMSKGYGGSYLNIGKFDLKTLK